MVRFAASALLVCCFALPCDAALKIDGGGNYKRDKLVSLLAIGAPEGAQFDWEVTPEEPVTLRELGAELLLVGPPGTYLVKCTAWTIKDGKLIRERARATVVVECAKPTPPPPAKPPEATKADPVAATAKFLAGRSSCTATIIGPRRKDGRWNILCAAHCTASVGQEGYLVLKDKRQVRVKVVTRVPRSDLVWMVTIDPIASMPFAKIATKAPEPGTPIWHMGYGVHLPGNLEKGTVVRGPDANGFIWMRISVSSGDSGCGLFRQDTGELIATLYGTSGGLSLGCGCLMALEHIPRELKEGETLAMR